jgi:hypothetical protein
MSAIERILPTLVAVESQGSNGMTSKELRSTKGWHHGIASGVLSHLHEQRRLVRLSQKRDDYKIYVTPRYVLGRDTEPHRHWRRRRR